MSLPDPPTYSVPELERKASEFLAEQLGAAPAIPIDIDLLLERLPGVQLDYFRGLRDEHGLDGMVLRDCDSGLLWIYIDEDVADRLPTRYRMTVAEELAHILLHRRLIDSVSDVAGFRELQRHRRCAEIERHAKRFAAALLMPGAAVVSLAEEIYPQLVKVVGYRDGTAIQKQLTTLMAKRFEVSTQTMGYRLSEWPVRLVDRIASAVRSELPYLPCS
ncbi:MAG: ImmA/IrrE family metallo-endopeptidase [Planctomycetota bacterium]